MYECVALFSGRWEVCEERLLGRHRCQSFRSPGHREWGKVVLQEKQQRLHEGEVGAACFTSPLHVHCLSPVLMVFGTPSRWFWTGWLCLLHQSILCTSSLFSSKFFGPPTHLLRSHWIAIIGWLCLLLQSILSTSCLSSSNGFWHTNSFVTFPLDRLIVPVTPVHFIYLMSLQF